MTDEKLRELETIVDRLRRERDELHVRAHLLKADLADEWADVEHKWSQVELRLERLRAGARESAGEIGAAASQLGEEIANAYQRLRTALK